MVTIRWIAVMVAWLLAGALFLSPSRAAEGEEKSAGTPKFTMNPGDGLTLTSASGETTFNLGFYVQARFQWLSYDQYVRSNPLASSPPIPVDNIGQQNKSFDLRRARMYMRGQLGQPWIKYKVEFDLVGNDEGLRNVFIPPGDPTTGFVGVNISSGAESKDGRTMKLLDAYVDLSPNPAANFRIGQFKIPHGREEIVSDNLLQMPARSISSDFFAPSRDRGVLFFGATPTALIGYQVGAFNGTGLTRGQNLDPDLAYVARLTAAGKGGYLDTESVIDDPATFHVQGSVSWYDTSDTPKRQSPSIPIGKIRDTRLSGDVEFFWPRANLILEYHSRSIDADYDFDLPASCFGAYLNGRLSCDSRGYTAQAGVLIAPEHELSARYSKIDNDTQIDRDERTEATLAYTYYIRRHALKLNVSVSQFKLGVNAYGSSGFDVQQGTPPARPIYLQDFPDAFPGLKDDKNTLFVTQLQWIF